MFSRRIFLTILALLLPVAAFAQSTNEDFFAAARKGDAAAVKAFLDKGVPVNAKTQYGATALSYACDKGHTEVVKLLIERGADVNVKDTFYGEVPLGWALGKGHAEIVKILLDHGAQGKDRALIEGADSGNVEIVKAVLDKGDLKPDTLSSALSQATKKNHTAIVEMLKKAGAQPPPPANFPVDAETLNSYAGAYKSDRAGDLTFAVKDGKLTEVTPGRQPFTMGAYNKNTFTILEFDGVTITFKVENGKVAGFTLKQSGDTSEFKRVAEK
ncbi:MAG: ankyrin repeat domain-containing protein [Blastocatellia bacterium]